MNIKVYVDVTARFNSEGVLIPLSLTWEDGEEFEIVSKDQYMSGLIKHNKYILQQLTKEGEEEDASEVQEDNL